MTYPLKNTKSSVLALMTILHFSGFAFTGQPPVKIEQAFGLFDIAKLEIHIDESWSSPRMVTPEKYVTDAKVIHQGNTWGLEIMRPVAKQVGLTSRFNIVYRDQAAIAVNTFMDKGFPVLSGSGFSIILHDEEISGAKNRVEQMWPTDGNVELPCFGILFGKQIYSPDGYLPNQNFETLDDKRVNIRSPSPYGEIEQGQRAPLGGLGVRGRLAPG